MKNIYSVVHAALAELSEFAGDKDVIHEFDSLPQSQKDKLIAGVDILVSNKDAGIEARHGAWMEKMLADGWKLGKHRDDVNKTHPRLVPFDQLPKKEVAKEKMLHTIVRALEKVNAAGYSNAPAQTGVPIKYIGAKDGHVDNLYGTRLEWKRGEIHRVPAAAAAKMLTHTDTYIQEGDAVQAEINGMDEVAQTHADIPLPNIEGMSTLELASFAQQYFGEKLPDDMSRDEMGAKVLSLVQSSRQ